MNKVCYLTSSESTLANHQATLNNENEKKKKGRNPENSAIGKWENHASMSCIVPVTTNFWKEEKERTNSLNECFHSLVPLH